MQLSSGKNSGPILIIVLVAVLLFAVYYYIVMPKQNEAELMENSVANLRNEISTIHEQITLIEEEQSSKGDNEFTLRKKVPNNRAIDELLLNMEEIEYVSGSRIQSISFNNYDSLVSTSGLVDPNAPKVDEDVDNTASASTEQVVEEAATAEEGTEQTGATTPVSTIAVEALPANLQLVTFEVSVQSPNYSKLQQFIKEIEQLERVMHIDMIDYSLPGEESAYMEDASEIVSAIIQVTTFYYK